MKVYCDTNVYNRCFDEQSQLRIRLECTAIEGIYAMVEAGRFELTWSFILDYENSLNPHADRKEWVELLSRLCAATIAPSPEILALAQRLIKVNRLNPRDALHVACAQVAECGYFITCDDRLVRRASSGGRRSNLQIQIVNPVDFIRRESGRYGKG